MAALTYQGTLQANNRVSVTRSTDDGIGSATVAIIVDNTKSKREVLEALEGTIKAIRLDGRNLSEVSQFPTSGTVVVQ